MSNNESEQRNFTHLIRCQTKSEAIHNIKHVKKACYHVVMRKTKIPMNKPYNIQNTNICNGIFHISFFKALLINEGETTRGEMTQGANRIRGEMTRYPEMGQD